MNWGSVADWVSGIGSMIAAIVALYLARRSERIRLTGFCGLRTHVGGAGPREEVLSIAVTNIGTRSTIINNIGMSVGRGRRRKKRYAIINFMKAAHCVGVPYSLGDGQQGYWSIPIDEEKTWFKDLCRGFVKKKDDIETIRFHIYTNHGEELTIHPEKSFRTELAAALEITQK
jgi:hypothetical protein